MPISGEVRRLVDRFQENRAAYVSGPYNETQLRREIVDLGHIAKTVHEKTIRQRQITSTDQQIAQLVYDLYGLTEDEVGIVKEETPQ